MKILLTDADITTLQVDGIVNAANQALLGGGGVDGAVHRAAGPQLLEACRALNGCETGDAKITPGFDLPARYIIHAVGPVWRDGASGETELLARCYERSLALAEANQLAHIAFPAISTGIYGFPKDRACAIAMDAVQTWQAPWPQTVSFCCFDAETRSLYETLLKALPG